MRICLYTESALPLLGGQEIAVDQLARTLIRLGHDVVVLAARHRGRIPIRDDEFPYQVIRHPRFVSTHHFVSWYKRYLERAWRQFRFDVLHCHSVQPTGYIAACSRLLDDVPVVITSQCGEIWPDSALLRKPGARERCYKALERANAVVTIGEFAERCVRAVGPKLNTVERIINGVEWSRFASPVERPQRFERGPKPGEYFLFLGRIVHRKGVDVLLEAFQQAAPRTTTRLVIAGDGLELEPMRQLAKRLKIDTRVDFVGRVEGNDKVWLLQNGLATVLPSREWEGCPLVAMESFAAGRAVIGTRTPGVEELITPGRNGYLVPSEAPAPLAEAIVDAACAPANTERLGANAQNFAKQHDWFEVARRYTNLFERLIAGPVTQRTVGHAA